MRILICDDENTYADELKSFIENYFLLRHLPVEITIKCNPIDIVNGNSAYEIAFLDIQMDNVDGLSLAKILKERNSKVAIFFITSFGRYQDDAMDLNAFRFFEKPFDPDRLCSGLDKVMEYIDRTYVDFFVYTNGIHKKIPADDILYVERDNRRSILHTLNETYSARESFDFWEKALFLYSPQIVYSKPALCNEIRLFRAVSTRQHKDPDSPEAAEGFSQILVRVPEEKMR